MHVKGETRGLRAAVNLCSRCVPVIYGEVEACMRTTCGYEAIAIADLSLGRPTGITPMSMATHYDSGLT